MINQNYKNFLKLNTKTISISIISVIYLLFTNQYFTIEESFVFGAADGYSYLLISQYSPNIPVETIQPIHSERFFFSYIIGFVSKIFNLNLYSFFRILIVFLIVLINLFLIIILKKLEVEESKIIFLTLLVNFNPYFSRFYIANPLIINDLIFHLGLLICILAVVKSQKKLFLLGTTLSILSRQSAIAIFLGIIFLKIFSKKNNLFDKKEIFLNLIIILIVYYMGYVYSSQTISYENERYDQYFVTIFGIFIEKKSMMEYLKFFIWPFLSFGPFFFYILFYNKFNFNKKINLNLIYFTFIVFLALVMQPILQGIEVSGRNIIRLTTLGYFPIIILLGHITYQKKLNFLSNIFLLLILFIWSCHPTFSKFIFLENFKF